MSRTLTEATAQACLDAVRAQFAYAIPPNPTKYEQPRLFPPGHNGSGWVIQWEGGDAPDSWPLLALQGGTDENLAALLTEEDVPREQAADRARITAVALPEGVHAEAINNCELGLYPA